MAKQGSTASPSTPLFSAAELMVFSGTALLAVFVLLLERWRPSQLSDQAASVFAIGSLVVTFAQWSRRPIAPTVMAFFLPAIPLAFAVQIVSGAAMGAGALAATALAFQARFLFLAMAAHRQHQRKALAASLESRLPEKATLFIDNDIQSVVSTSMIEEGHLVRIEAGQAIPADGTITYGSGIVNEIFADSTEGENLQIKGAGSMVFAGTFNKSGALLIRVNAVRKGTFLFQLAARMRNGSELNVSRLLALDVSLLIASVAVTALSGPASALRVFLLSSSAACLAVIGAFEIRLAETSLMRRWLWNPGGLKKISKAGMLVLRSEGVLSEGRPRLVAIDPGAGLSEDAVIGLLSPIARKLETPPALALLRELRLRNIPFKQMEYFQQLPDGGFALVAGEEIRWISLSLSSPEILALGSLEPFVREHLAVGDEISLLERGNRPVAALAFRDMPIKGVRTTVEELQAISLPALLVSSLPKNTIDRLKTELGFEHAQGESGDKEVEKLMDRLAGEGLSPAWVQTSPFRPQRSAAVAALPGYAEGADFSALHLNLPQLADSACFARDASLKLVGCLSLVVGSQLLLCLFAMLPHAASLSTGTLALLGVIPGFVSTAWCGRRLAADSPVPALAEAAAQSETTAKIV